MIDYYQYSETLRPKKRWYIVIFILVLCAIWGMAAAYFVLSPKKYTSAFLMVIPGPGGVSSVNLENLGSSTTNNSSVFSSPDISPTENYKRIILSHRTIKESAELSGMKIKDFPLPRVDLLEQTKLLKVSVTGKTPELSVEHAESLRNSFLKILEELRDDEIKQRETRTSGSLEEYKLRLQQAKDNLLKHQLDTKLMSLDQYREIIGNIEKTRTSIRDIDARLAKGESEEKSITSLLGADASDASRAMILRADPLFQSLLETSAKQEAEISTLSGIRGNTNPRLVDAIAEKASVMYRLSARSFEILGRRIDINRMKDVSLKDERARLFEKIVILTADNASLRSARVELINQQNDEQERISLMSSSASTLERLNREVQLAEAVFTSALGRSNSSRSDFFASYPMVQTLELPSYPETPSSPQLLIALGGAGVGTIIIMFALVLIWLRKELFRKIVRSA